MTGSNDLDDVHERAYAAAKEQAVNTLKPLIDASVARGEFDLNTLPDYQYNAYLGFCDMRSYRHEPMSDKLFDGDRYHLISAKARELREARSIEISAAYKDDSFKLPEHLYSIPAHNRLLEVLALGAAKYGERNWQKGMNWSRVYAAAERHLHAWWNGEDLDPETKKSHLAHAFANLMFLNHYEQTNIGTDDRSPS